MAFFKLNSSVSWIFLLTILFSVTQASFPLHQDDVPAIHDVPATQIENNTNDDTVHSENQPIEAVDFAIGNDSRNCFPYFIYQDVESLLNQAFRMLSMSKTDRQRSWLQLFIHRLESLLTQLRRLPVSYANQCFRAKERANPSLPVDSDLSSAPEEVQLQLAKKLFLSSKHRVNKKHHLNDQVKEFITGRVFHGRSRDHPEHGIGNQKRSKMPNQSNKAHIAQESNKDIEPMPSNLENLYNFEVNSGAAAVDKGKSRYRNGNNPYNDVLIPITFWEKQNMNPETMPFLPRATRKIAHPVSEKMKSRPLPSQSKHADTTTEVEEQTQPENQTRLPSPPNDYTVNNDKKHHEEMTPTVISRPEDTNITPPTHHNRQDNVAQLEDHDVSWLSSIDANYNVTAPDKNADISNSEDDDDDLVIQLHSGGKLVKQQMDPRVFLKSQPLEVKTWPRGIPEGQSKSPESEEIPNSKEHDGSEETVMKTEMTTNKNQEDEMPGANENKNNLDFDYEEPGAAAGELYIDDDVIPTKYLTVPSAVSSIIYDDNQDDIVRQLDELKALKSDVTLLNNPMASKESEPVKSSKDDRDHSGYIRHFIGDE